MRLYGTTIFWIMCILCTPRPIYRPTYWLIFLVKISTAAGSVCWSIYGQHIDRLSADISVDIGATLGGYVDWYLSAEYQTTVTGLSVNSLKIYVKSWDCHCQMYKLCAFHLFSASGKKKIWKLDTSSSIFPTAPRQRWNPHPREGFANQIPNSPVMVR